MRVTDIPVERSRFRYLIAANPNYFGNLEKSSSKAVKKIVGDTTYEQLTCVGYNLDHSALEATIAIKRASGYKGDLCSGGSTEYVRFFVEDGANWIDLGYVGTDVHDIPDGKDCSGGAEKPLTYVVTLPYSPNQDICFRPKLLNIRAILSWDHVPSTNANVPPIWGNVVDVQIQVKPRRWRLIDVVSVIGNDKIKIPDYLIDVQDQPIPIPDPGPLSIAMLAKTYAQEKVEPHRFGFEHFASVVEGGAIHPMQLSEKISEFELAKVDWTSVVAALEKTSGNTTYEQLDCLGLDENREALVASFRIKRNSGFSGSLCQRGSYEYISFWADWEDTCNWTYLSTVSVNVHDINGIAAGGLHYTALLPVDLSQHRRTCKEPKVGRVRAVLSWGAPPSVTDPDAVPYWGNRIDSHVLIQPTGTNDERRITILGGIGVDDINITGNGLTKPNAKFALLGSFADPYISTRSCPFGGQIVIQGAGTPHVGTYYRLWARNNGSDAPQILRNSIWIVDQNGVGSLLDPDANGFFPYLSYLQNFDQVLGYWFSGGNGLGEVFLEWTDGAKNVLGSTFIHKMQLWHTAPDAAISLDAGPCHFYTPGEAVSGTFVARSTYTGHFSLYTLPQSVSPPAPSTSTPSTSNTAPAPGDVWTLNTMGLPRCGYVVRVEVYDRTIVGSGPSGHNGAADDKGFCLIPN